MADVPVEIEGNSARFTISTQVTRDPQTGAKNVAGDKLGIDPGGDPLQMRFANSNGAELKVPLGEEWSIIIEKLGAQ